MQSYPILVYVKPMNAPFYYDWTKADGDAVAQLTAITGAPGNLWPYPLSALPRSIETGMPEIRKIYISGYAIPEAIPNGLEAIGELLVTRNHTVPGSGKAYLYLIGIDQENVPYFRGPYKPYPTHYYNEDNGVPVDRLFGRIDRNLLDQTRV